MKRFPAHYFQINGYNLFETLLIVVVVGVVVAFAVVNLGNPEETRDAKLVQDAQTSLQGIVSQGAAHMELTPKALKQEHPEQILFAIQSAFGEKEGNHGNVWFERRGDAFVMTLRNSHRQAFFTVTDSGDVNLDKTEGFTLYRSQNGIIRKI